MLTENGTKTVTKMIKLQMKDIGKIYCIRLTVREDYPMKIKNISVEDNKKNNLKKDSNQILKCGEFCNAVFCDEKVIDGTIQKIKGAADFLDIIKCIFYLRNQSQVN